MLRLAAGLALLAAGAAAAERLSPEAFEAETAGRTVIFALDGAPFGAEQYLGGGEVIWQGPSGECLRGRWHADGRDICFTYEDAPTLPQCWEVWRDEAGLLARLSGAPPGSDLRAVASRRAPLACPGPDAGV